MRQSIIPEWADKRAKRVIEMFKPANDGIPNMDLLHGAVAAALVQEREAGARTAEAVTRAPLQYNAKDKWREQIGKEIADTIRGSGK